MPFLDLGRNKQIYYELIDGEPDRPHLVFIHEGLGCAAMWKGFPHQLCRETGCPGLLYDSLGYGKSSPLDGPMNLHFLHRYALIELPAVIEQLIPEKEYVLIGHSDGGSIGLIAAAERPLRLKGLIAEAAHVFVEEKTLAGIRATVDAFRAGKLRGLFRYHGDKTEELFTAWSGAWLSDGFRPWNIEYALPSIACPVLVIQGTEDNYGTVAQVDTIMAKVPDARKVMIEGCGHVPHLERSAEVLGLMAEFVERLPA
ncbi:alpha/beta hydrolase fold protein [Geobacter metallireducens RCH3]|uniref:Hydrolase or acyltransferase, alpha/beta fold family n=1 Tax=Geobacter metallireducens (strain ATCC 53774 / DSM 7210 / GS-15) TaxID=269799 RepID=Q39Q64_GEOMG|nr:alpha/beta hydrolase [Geobacter metallireducens]ABB33610.1 hydrolase or acyltransferase, alpha/beta fold family [Geobacter metallireducens GS-15]EHP84830.1 alpha/beta hydrolase fold protein [Geobacter metallireducens RCH3]